MGQPLWYTPKGGGRPPAHCPAHGGLPQLQPGPDGTLGTVWGGPMAHGRTWTRDEAGWWVSLDRCQPQDLLRLAPLPGVTIEDTIDPGRMWMVPQLLTVTAAGLVVVDHLRVYRQGAWQARPDVAPLAERLRALIGWGDAPPESIGDDQVLDLLVPVLALNYHLSRTELSAAGWLHRALATDLLAAACGGA